MCGCVDSLLNSYRMGHLASLYHDPSDFQGAFMSNVTSASPTGSKNEAHSAKDLTSIHRC